MLRKLYYYTLAGLLLLPGLIQGQWVANPEKAKRLIVDNYAPYNIITLENPNNGAFIVWQDQKEKSNSVLLYQSIDKDGKVRMQADGKRVTELPGSKEGPLAAVSPDGSTYILWKDFTNSQTGTLYLQKIQFNATSDGIALHSSRTPKYEPGISIDKDGSVFAFWLEARQGKNLLMMQTLMGTQQTENLKQPVQVSLAGENVLSYVMSPVKKDRLMLAWQLSGKFKEVNFQLFNSDGIKVLPEAQRICTRVKGSKVSFQLHPTPDSGAVVSWIQENSGRRFLFFKKINSDGKSEWGDTAKSASKSPLSIFGYSVCIDKPGNIYTTWLERNEREKHLDIYAQKFTSSGKNEWGPKGFKMLSSSEFDKSYLSVVNYARQSVAAIYRESNKLETVIYGQRLFAEQKGISSFADVSAQVNGDSIVVNWRMQNETHVKYYHIEKFLLKTARDTSWSEVASVAAKPFSASNDYRFSFVPDSDGIYFIRVVQQADGGVLSVSENQKVSYLKEYGDNIILLQNNPNPFTDSTTIMYYLPEAMTVHLEIYNSRIERIDEYYLRDSQKGRNKYVFHARQLPEGVYFYRFTAGSMVEVKKMVVTR
ncbi:MAG: hypothetical protein HYV28_15700 [Ignavibacteriales bacterium]|nr:hypothetical protein [Ignavibacteriales bacterium]